MKNIFIILLFITLMNSLFAISTIDSLESKLKIVVAEEKVKVLNSLSKEYLYISPIQSIFYAEQAAKLAITFNDMMNEHKAYNNIANSYALLKDYKKSIFFFEKALSKSEIIGDIDLILNDIYKIADVFSSSKNYTKSIEYYNKALKINEITDNRSEIALSLNRIGLEYKKAGQYKQASEFFLEALRFGEENVLVLMRDEYKQISEFYSSRGEDEKALEYYKLFSTMKDTIAIVERSKKISNMQVRYEEEQRLRRIELLKKEKEIQDLELQQLTLQQEKQEKEFIASQRSSQIKSLSREKELKASQLKIAEYEKEKVQRQMSSIQKDNEIRDLELDKQKFTQKALIFVISFIFVFAVVSFYFAFTNIKTNTKLKAANAKLEQISKTDPLTDLANRRDMIERMKQEQIRFSRNRKSFVLLMSDIDSFKKINDNHGHACGDFILKSLAKQMKSTARKQDITGRWGGEEFLMLLPETDIDGGFALAEKIRKDIETTTYNYSDSKISLTMTFGVSMYDRLMDIDHCVKMADEALYRGKRQGKNCVVMSKPRDKAIFSSVLNSIDSA